MIFSDNPILTKEEDEFGLSTSSSHVANLIYEQMNTNQDSFVLGINGERGEGRSSFMYLIREDVQEFPFKGESPGTVFINPWLFHTSSDLVTHVFAEYAEKIAEQNPAFKNTIIKFGRRLADYVEMEVSVGPVKVKTTNQERRKKQRRIEKVQQKISRLDLTKPIILFVDHIDQLEPIKAKFLIRVLETIRREFPYTAIVLTYDRENLVQKLTDLEAGINGNDAINALVDVPFVLPQPGPQQFSQVAHDKFNEVLRGAFGDGAPRIDKNDDEVSHNLFKFLPFILETPRELKQCASSLCLNLRLFHGADGVDTTDIVAIHVLAFKFPHFYYKMQYRDYIFLMDVDTAREESTENLRNKTDLYEKYQGYIQNILDKPYRKPVDRICKALFPQILEKNFNSDDDGIRPRVRYKKHYWKYMQLPVDED